MKTTPPGTYAELYASWGDPRKPDFESKFIVGQRHLIGRELVTIRSHIKIAPLLHNVWAELMSNNLLNLIHTFDGCFNIRNIRNGSDPSLHSWGLALDLNAAELPLGSLKRFDLKVVRAFERQGFFYGGNFNHRKDPMHFQFTQPHTI